MLATESELEDEVADNGDVEDVPVEEVAGDEDSDDGLAREDVWV